MQRIAVASYRDIKPGGMKEVEASNTPILVAEVAGSLYAIDGRCSHGQGKLAQGVLEGYVVKCPLHGATFDLRTGEVVKPKKNAYGMPVGGPATANLRTYRVVEEESQVFVEIP